MPRTIVASNAVLKMRSAETDFNVVGEWRFAHVSEELCAIAMITPERDVVFFARMSGWKSALGTAALSACVVAQTIT